MTDDTTQIIIPSAFVSAHYINDPETEDLIYGDKLKNGMIVLIGDNIMRGDPDREDLNPYEESKIRERNRWALVESLRPSGPYSEIVNFIAVYADGTKIPRTYNQSHAWYVKKSSM